MKQIDFSAANCLDLAEFLQKTSSVIQENILDLIPGENKKGQSENRFLYDLMRDYPLRGGKKFRSALVFLSCEWFGGTIAQALHSALAFELFQNFALIHDDIEDNSLMRRGKAALHRLHGIPLALNAGDNMLCLVYHTLLSNRSPLGDELSFRILQLFNEVAKQTFEGQAMDIGWVIHDVFPDRNEYQKMITRKTGWYSGRGPCQCGAMIGGASEENLGIIGQFGEAIGIGFQARDDILNLISDSEKRAPFANSGGYGKERGGDIAEGKRTLIMIELFERLPPDKKKQLHRILLESREETTESEVEWVIQQAKNYGALDSAIAYCQDHANRAWKNLDRLPDHPVRGLMKSLVSYLTIDRNF